MDWNRESTNILVRCTKGRRYVGNVVVGNRGKNLSVVGQGKRRKEFGGYEAGSVDWNRESTNILVRCTKGRRYVGKVVFGNGFLLMDAPKKLRGEYVVRCDNKYKPICRQNG